jgi:NAD-dependent histone deacetylase SIR2
VKAFTVQLKEKGIVNFLREYLASGEGDELASLRKLLLGFGVVPVSLTAVHDRQPASFTTTLETGFLKSTRPLTLLRRWERFWNWPFC